MKKKIEIVMENENSCLCVFETREDMQQVIDTIRALGGVPNPAGALSTILAVMNMSREQLLVAIDPWFEEGLANPARGDGGAHYAD